MERNKRTIWDQSYLYDIEETIKDEQLILISNRYLY